MLDIPLRFNLNMSRNTSRTLNPLSSLSYVPWVIDKSCLIQESVSLKPDWFVEMKKEQTSWYITEKVASAGSLLDTVVVFLFGWVRTICPFFHSSGIMSISKQDLKINSRGLHIDSPHIFNIRMLILLWPCAFTESKFWFFYDAISRKGYIIQKLICFKQELRRDTVAVIDYYALFRKNGLNNSAFFVKIVTTCFNRTQAEYSEFFLIIQKHF